LEIVLDPSDPQRDVQRALLQRVAADEADERDWRSRAPAPSPAGAPPAGAPAAAAARESAPQDPNAPRIQRATDIGRTAWAAGVAEAEGTAQTLRKVKGILNKVTPEKFERLLSQLIPMIASYDVLQGTIRQVFENAVAQPTFVPMYADLCAELDAALPEFEGPDGPQFFKKMLANTCQEEYESTDAARSAAAQLTGESREDAERKAKQRLLGNVRLIAELFKKGMVNDRIMLLILSDLLGPSDGEPSEDALEAACEVLTVAGAALEENARSKAKLEAAFVHLARLTGSKTYSSRVRFVVKDVIDLRSQHWVNRRESFTARKLEDIRTEAAAELGIVDVAIPGLEPLIPGVDSLPGMGGMNGGKRGDDMELFPALRGQNLSSAPGAPGGDGKFSAFLGEFVPESVPQSNATPPEAPGQAPR
jgi:translation initiation factor 4G